MTSAAAPATLEEVLSCLPTGVLVVDGDDRIAAINHPATMLLRDGLVGVGLRLRDALRPAHSKAVDAVMGQVRAQGYALGQPQALDVGDDKSLSVTLSGSAPRPGQPLAVLVVQDASAAEELARRTRRDERRRELVAETAHEVMNPMTAILGMLELLKASPDTVRVRGHIERALSAASRLRRLIVDILEDSRIERRAVTMRRVPVDLRGTIEAVTPPGLAVVLDLEPGLTSVPVDPARFERVVANLLDNAAKYSPPGQPVTVQARRVDAAVELAVVDQGPGIDPEDLPFLFERHYRPRARARTVATSSGGLGLAIARTIVEAHGGTIHVESVPGRGSTFRVRLPAE